MDNHRNHEDPRNPQLEPLLRFAEKKILRHRCIACQEKTGKEETMPIKKTQDPLAPDTTADVTWGLCPNCQAIIDEKGTIIFCDGQRSRCATFKQELAGRLFKPEALGQCLKVTSAEFDVLEETCRKMAQEKG